MVFQASGSRWFRLLNRASVSRWSLLVLPSVAFLIVFYVWPLLVMAERSIGEPPGAGLSNFAAFFDNPADIRVFVTTVRTALVVTVVTLLIGYPYAYLMHVASSRWRGLLMFAVLLPFWSSLLVRTYAWTVILRDTGVLNSLLQSFGVIHEPLLLIRTQVAVLIGMTHILLPFMVLPLFVIMERIDPDFDLAARNLGAGPFTSFRRVFLPMSLPGVLAGSLLVFVLALGYFITPALLGGPRDQMLSQLIVNQVSHLLDWGLGSAMAVILTVLTMVVLAVAALFVKAPDLFGSRAREE